jgi:hypothetical protein
MKETKLSLYELTRNFWDFCFENPDLVKPNDIALYFFILEHNNRLGWKTKFGLPTSMAMEATSIKSYNTYKASRERLVDWGFIIMVQESKNQYSSCIVAVSKFDKANNKALDKALMKHSTTHNESSVQSNDSIDKQINNTTTIQGEEENHPPPYSQRFLIEIEELEEFLNSDQKWKEEVCMQNEITTSELETHIISFVKLLRLRGETSKTPRDAKGHFVNWYNQENQKSKNGTIKNDRRNIPAIGSHAIETL